MRLKTRSKFGGLLLLLATAVTALAPARSAHAWAEHHLITRAALSQVGELHGKTVTPSEFGVLLGKLGFSSPRAFNESIQIRKEYPFEFKIHEVAGTPVPLIDVLAHYSDEPDWGMDQELFGADQYPELWRDEYSMMGGKKGTPSQSFRHMYWRGFHLLHPLKTFKLPLARIFRSMGHAHERAAIFVGLAQKARTLGEPYWEARFVANALHYLEDVSSLFHSTQTPTKKFMWLPLFNKEYGSGLTDYVAQVTNIISYYHFAFEDYIGYLMKQHYAGHSSPESEQFVQALSGTDDSCHDLSARENGVSGQVRNLAYRSLKKSSGAARASMEFFPELTAKYATVDPGAFLDASWWARTIEGGKQDSDAKRRYFDLVRQIFEPQGFAVRELVRVNLLDSGGKARP